jgi:hypothetical protein
MTSKDGLTSVGSKASGVTQHLLNCFLSVFYSANHAHLVLLYKNQSLTLPPGVEHSALVQPSLLCNPKHSLAPD